MPDQVRRAEARAVAVERRPVVRRGPVVHRGLVVRRVLSRLSLLSLLSILYLVYNGDIDHDRDAEARTARNTAVNSMPDETRTTAPASLTSIPGAPDAAR